MNRITRHIAPWTPGFGVVIHRGRRTDPALDAREAEMAKMSSVGAEWVAKESDHFIQIWQPDMVTAAIRQVITGKRAAALIGLQR